jgi:hypothetical protein
MLATVDPMDATDLHFRHELAARPGESNPAKMLCLVLVLLAVIAPLGALALVWWLA